ncbi:isomerase [Escherichia coli]|uniref:PrpF domain-containing protein n=1 Tax=Escherichia coli TaxID=562 RepID=UPI0009443D00|nr:PrpF domain-containing protein [Escherichia coli]OKV21356.1 isomerase [Escherichia coli]
MKKIPCVMMRGGTSRGAFLLAEHLPEDQTQRDKILMAIMGSGNDLEIDGIGGGNPLTSKVAIISRSSDPRADVDYLFAQVIVHEQRVDTTPNCGNMLSGVGAFAIENGLIAATSPVTRVRIRNVNTGTFIEADVQTPNGVVEYEGSTLLARIESIRLQAGKAMGLGDVSNMVIPKPVLISPAQKGGAINVRYFMPHSCHRALAITGAIAISSSCALEGTVTRQIVPSVGYGNINIEHPSGALDVHLSNEGQDATTLRASVIRTTRKIFSGEVYLP